MIVVGIGSSEYNLYMVFEACNRIFVSNVNVTVLFYIQYNTGYNRTRFSFSGT